MQTYKEWLADYQASGMADCHSLCEVEAVGHPPLPTQWYYDVIGGLLLSFIVAAVITGLIHSKLTIGRWTPPIVRPEDMSDEEFADWQCDKSW